MENADICPACGGSGVCADEGLRRCPACGLARAERQYFTDPNYPGLDEAVIYDHSKGPVIRGLLDDLRRFMPSGGKLLDVGCASGELMRAAAAAGWQCSGVEVSTRLAAAARKSGSAVAETPFEDFVPRENFDAVVFHEVLSQAADPRPQLEKAFSLLRPGGMVFIREYNAAFHLRAMALSGLAPLRALGLRPGVIHNWNYTPASMRALLAKAGFAEIELRNARPSSGDPYGTGGSLGPLAVGVFKSLYYAVASGVSVLTSGRVLISSVFDARGRRPPGGR